MPMPRTPVEKAEITGQAKHNRKRFAGRAKSKSAPIGAPAPWMNEKQAAAFELLKRQWGPWVKEKDRVKFEMAAKLYARMIDDTSDEMGVTVMNQLRLLAGEFGGDPAAFSKISTGEDGDEDPAERFFN